MPAEITRLVNTFLNDPVRVEVARPATTAKTITQRFSYCADGEDWAKRDMLRKMIGSENVKNAIIFCNRKRDVAILLKSLLKHGFNAGALHGDMDQSARTATLDKFRSGDIQLLAASDVAARGLDIPDVSHIFNFDLPWQPDDYVHRIGRTGRAGKEGRSLSIVTPDDLKSLKDIEKMLGEDVVWIGEGPSEQDYADSGKKRRGRGGRGAPRRPDAGPRREGRPEHRGAQGRKPAAAHDREPQAQRPAQERATPPERAAAPERNTQERAERRPPKRSEQQSARGQGPQPAPHHERQQGPVPRRDHHGGPRPERPAEKAPSAIARASKSH